MLGFYGELNEDFYCSMAFFSTNNVYKTRRQNGWKMHKQACQKIFELLQPKYAWLALNPWQGGGTEVNRRLYPGTNIAYPWTHNWDMQVFGAELVERHNLRRFWWENESDVFFYKWLIGNILWLEGPNGIVDESFNYKDYPDIFIKNLDKHRKFTKRILLEEHNETYDEKPVTGSMILDL